MSVCGAVAGTATVTDAVYATAAPAEFVSVIVNVFEAVTPIAAEPFTATVPTPWSIDAETAFVDVHASVTVPPPAGSDEDETVNVPDAAGVLTDTFTRYCWMVPVELVSVSVYDLFVAT